MKVHNFLSHGDTPMCQIWYVKKQRRSCPNTNIILILRSKVKVIQRSWIYVIQCPMVIHSCDKYGRTKSKDEKAVPQTQSHVKNSLNLKLRSKVNVVSRSWMNATHFFMVIDPCAKYCKPMSKQKKFMGQTWICRQTDGRTEMGDFYINNKHSERVSGLSL